MSDHALELLSISCTFHSKDDPGQRYTAVADTTLRIRAGEFVSVVGPTGCGKSTLLNVGAGLLEPSSGTVKVFGKTLEGVNARAGYMFQTEALMPWRSAIDNVMVGLQYRGVPDADARRQAEAWLARVGLAGFGDRYPHQLSGGMRHRAALARALINRPRILLMDEPFAALDAITREQMQNFLLDLWQRERMTVLFVTHDVEEAALLSDRVCIMSPRPGRIVDIVDIELARPRDEALRDTAEFVALRHELRKRLASA